MQVELAYHNGTDATCAVRALFLGDLGRKLIFLRRVLTVSGESGRSLQARRRGGCIQDNPPFISGAFGHIRMHC